MSDQKRSQLPIPARVTVGIFLIAFPIIGGIALTITGLLDRYVLVYIGYLLSGWHIFGLCTNQFIFLKRFFGKDLSFQYSENELWSKRFGIVMNLLLLTLGLFLLGLGIYDLIR